MGGRRKRMDNEALGILTPRLALLGCKSSDHKDKAGEQTSGTRQRAQTTKAPPEGSAHSPGLTRPSAPALLSPASPPQTPDPLAQLSSPNTPRTCLEPTKFIIAKETRFLSLFLGQACFVLFCF